MKMLLSLFLLFIMNSASAMGYLCEATCVVEDRKLGISVSGGDDLYALTEIQSAWEKTCVDEAKAQGLDAPTNIEDQICYHAGNIPSDWKLSISKHEL